MILNRKYFKQQNIREEHLTDHQLESLKKIELTYLKLSAEHIFRIIFFIKYDVQDLFDTFERYYELVRDKKQTKKLGSLIYIFGEDIGKKIYNDRGIKIQTGKWKTENIVEGFINNGDTFKKSGIHYSTLTEIQKMRLCKVLDTWSLSELGDMRTNIARFITLDLTNYYGRIRRLFGKPGNGALVTLLRYGKKSFPSVYANICKQRLVSNKFTGSYWTNKGISVEVAVENVREFQKQNNQAAIAIIKGSSEYTCRSLNYWLRKGCTPETAQKEVNRVQHRNHTPERNDAWQATLNAKSPAEKKLINQKKGHSIEANILRGYAPEEAEERSIAYYKKRNNYSNISQKLFDMVSELLGSENLYYKILNYEKQFFGRNVDFYDAASETVIEFYGDFWHANPIKAKSTDLIYKKFACWQRIDDQRRLDLIEQHPKVKNIHIIWESEFRWNPRETANIISEFLIEVRHGLH